MEHFTQNNPLFFPNEHPEFVLHSYVGIYKIYTTHYLQNELIHIACQHMCLQSLCVIVRVCVAARIMYLNKKKLLYFNPKKKIKIRTQKSVNLYLVVHGII